MAAAAVVSVSMGVMKPVLSKLTTLMGDEYKKLKGLRKEVTFLQHELRYMNALLENMDNADELDPQAKNWRKDIIDMSYKIEDYIDDFMLCVGEADDKMGILSKASQYLKTFKDRRRLANQFQEIKDLVIEASKRRKRYKLDQCISITTPVFIDPRLSALYKDSASLVGIETQKNELVECVMDERQQLKVMSIVGLGGLGKTTLANEVYREVGGKFNYKAFISVSQKPKMIGLFNSLLSQLGLRPYSHACQEQDPINDLRGHLQDKRYFILVDDLWDIQAWNTICCAFPQNSQHSRILITTRIEGVARACCGNHGFIYTLKPLGEADSRKLFFDRIFGSEYACPSELTKAAREILKKCGGLPLAIITMAGMLACQQTRLEGQWEYIQNSLATKSATDTNYEDMMYILDLSYKNLPRQLKACFLYLGSYPEDYTIDRVQLVRRWVAEGFVSNSDRQDVWDVAESYFNELVNRSMIQPAYNYFGTKVSVYKVHDMLLELIVGRCKEDNFLSLVNDPQAVVEAQDKVIRRLTVVGLRGTDDGKVAINNLSQLRSLTILGGSNYMIPPLLGFKFVRVLFLEISSNSVTIDLTDINKLSQLRYLKVEGYYKNLVLPRQIRGLQLLETLDFSRIFNCSITLEIADVPRLSHLLVRKGTRLPDWIGEVKSLRTLRGFYLTLDSLGSIAGLGKLTALSDLHLYAPMATRYVRRPEATWVAALCTSLEKLCNLRQLDVSCGSVASCSDKYLYMRGLTFSRVPRWISHLQNLRVLFLGAEQILQEDVAIVGTRLPSLVRLGLRIPGAPTGRIVIGGSTGFPAVERFEFKCDGISYLTFEAGAMPMLRELELVFDASEWDKAAPGGLQHLPSLEKIKADRVRYRRASKRMRCNNASEDEVEAEAAGRLIRGVFQEAADALATRPALILDENLLQGGLRFLTNKDRMDLLVEN